MFSYLNRRNKWFAILKTLGFFYVVVCLLIIYSANFVYENEEDDHFEKPFLTDLENVTSPSPESFQITTETYNEPKSSEQSKLSFLNIMTNFPWESYKSAVESKNHSGIQAHSTELLQKIIPFLTKSPQILSNDSCVPGAHQILELTRLMLCRQLKKPRKVGILLQFGFDVDTLEIHLHELNDFVDKFFILESIHPHNSYISSKPLIWDLIKYDDRFAKFVDKIVYFVVDDADLAKIDPGNIWSRESQQEFLRWKKFLEWNNATKYFSETDLLGFGDVDEIPSRENVFLLKSCQIQTDSVDIGIWFPMNGLDTVFRTDFPVRGHPYTLGDPTFWTLASAKNYFKVTGKTPTRMRGQSAGYLLGGAHLSRYAYPPFQMAKYLTATESDLKNLKLVVEVGMLYKQGNIIDAEGKLSTLPGNVGLVRIQDLEVFRTNYETEANSIVKIPWFLNCNRERYPGYDQKYDSRLDMI